ncbi:HigA family addiction module antitoxin [Stenotrophomonas rhizophila]
MRAFPYPHPGEILQEEFLVPFGLSHYRLAKGIDVAQTHIGEIVAGRRSITAHTALHLSRFFGTTDIFWLNLQAAYEAGKDRYQLVDVLAKIERYRRVD